MAYFRLGTASDSELSFRGPTKLVLLSFVLGATQSLLLCDITTVTPIMDAISGIIVFKQL